MSLAFTNIQETNRQQRPARPQLRRPRLASGLPAICDDIDRAALQWIARFRFVDAEVLALHLGVSRRRANARVSRLADAGLLARRGHAPNEAWTIALTRRGATLLGLPRRRPARTDVQREHELALAWLVTEIERRGGSVLTERECRTLELQTGARFSVDVGAPNGLRAKRWPDLVLPRAAGDRLAIEFERTPKSAARLVRIVEGYRDAAEIFAEVRFYFWDPVTARGLARAIAATDDTLSELGPRVREPILRIAPWPGLPQETKDALVAGLRPRPLHS